MIKLFDYLVHLPSTTDLFTDINSSTTTQDLFSEFNAISSTLIKTQGKKVALNLTENYQLAKFLLFLDGTASSILILPPEISHEERLHFLALAQTELILTQEDLPALAIESINIANIAKNTKSDVSIASVVIETEWIIATSGTTGTPKLVAHSLKSLSNTTLKQSVGSKFTWGLLYDLHRFAGIQVYLQALMSGSKLVITESNQNLDDCLTLFRTHKVNCLSGTPTLWRKLLMHKGCANLTLSSIALGGETADESILNALRDTYPNAKIRHIYASTEAGVGFSVTDGKAGFPADYLDDSKAQVLLKLSDANTLLIKSNSVANDYIGTDNLNTLHEYIDTGDLIRIDGKRCFFEGRLNGAINVGGNKVQAEQVEAVLMSFPGIALARVSAKRNPITGNLVQAEVIVNDAIKDKVGLKDLLQDHCRTHLPRYMVPALIRIVDDIALTATGKIDRK